MRVKLITAEGKHVAYVKPAVAIESMDTIAVMDKRKLLIWGTRFFLFNHFRRPMVAVYQEVMPTLVIEENSDGL